MGLYSNCIPLSVFRIYNTRPQKTFLGKIFFWPSPVFFSLNNPTSLLLFQEAAFSAPILELVWWTPLVQIWLWLLWLLLFDVDTETMNQTPRLSITTSVKLKMVDKLDDDKTGTNKMLVYITGDDSLLSVWPINFSIHFRLQWISWCWIAFFWTSFSLSSHDGVSWGSLGVTNPMVAWHNIRGCTLKGLLNF